jgi:hypothetical protein
MRRIALRAVVGVTVAFGVAAAPASAAPPCENVGAFVRGLDAGDPVATGRSTVAITISGQDEGQISNVVASFPAPASVQATLTAPGKVALAMNVPSAGNVTLTISWDELTHSTPPGSTESVVTCTQTERIPLRAVKPASIGVRGEGTAFANGIVARFPLYGCKAPLVAAPVTITVRYRLGPKRRAFGPTPIPPAPTARSPKLVFVVPKPCGDTVPRQRVALPGKGSVSGGKSAGSQFEAIAARRARGRYAYGAHMRVEFAQPGFKTVRFDVTGYFHLGASGKASSTTVRRLR